MRGIWNKLLKDWTLNGGLTASSGTPYTATVSGNSSSTAGTGLSGTTRAEATGASVDGGSFFNLGAFTTPPAGYARQRRTQHHSRHRALESERLVRPVVQHHGAPPASSSGWRAATR